MKGIVLVSGGLDSLVTAAIAHQECDSLYLLHAGYGQPTAEREMDCFYKIAAHFQADDLLTVDIPYLVAIGGSSLTDVNLPIPDYNGSGKMPSTYVPFRNAHLLCIAVSWAEVIGAEKIYIGAVEEDSSGYPDCRENFFSAMQKAVNLGTQTKKPIEIVTPVIHMKKSEIIKKALELAAPLQLSWSCYRNSDRACGTCDSCVLRIEAFKKAGIPDPIDYDIDINWYEK